MNLLEIRNIIITTLKKQGVEITSCGIFLDAKRPEADICVTATDGEQYHIVIVNRE